MLHFEQPAVQVDNTRQTQTLTLGKRSVTVAAVFRFNSSGNFTRNFLIKNLPLHPIPD